jgi:hypothetical protein
MSEYIGYHGTSEINYNKIRSKQFKLSRPKGTLPCDLGYGIYMYIQREEFPDECPKENAEKYLQRYKPKYKKPVILEIRSEIANDKVLNLNKHSNQSFFLKFKKNNLDRLEKEFHIQANTPTKKRGNADGMVLDIMIENVGIPVDAVIVDSYTPIDFHGYNRSNIPNGREFCLKNPDKINLFEIV